MIQNKTGSLNFLDNNSSIKIPSYQKPTIASILSSNVRSKKYKLPKSRVNNSSAFISQYLKLKSKKYLRSSNRISNFHSKEFYQNSNENFMLGQFQQSFLSPLPKLDKKTLTSNPRLITVSSRPKSNIYSSRNLNSNEIKNKTNNQKLSKETSLKDKKPLINEFSNTKRYHLTAFMSTQAQYATIKVYEDMIVNELCKIYPNLDISEKKQINNNRSLSSMSYKHGSNEERAQCSKTVRPQSSKTVYLEEDRMSKISFFIDNAIEILDSIQTERNIFRKKSQSNSFSNESFEKNDDPLEKFSKWVNLCDQELNLDEELKENQ